MEVACVASKGRVLPLLVRALQLIMKHGSRFTLEDLDEEFDNGQHFVHEFLQRMSRDRGKEPHGTERESSEPEDLSAAD